MGKVLEIKGIGKTINNNVILKDVNLSLEFGNIYGLKGMNGSGKTVLLKIICGIMFPTEGEILLDNKSYTKDKKFLESLGALIEYPGFIKDENGFNNLKYLADINSKISDDSIKEAIKRVGLDYTDKRKVKKYSLGMKQRLGIAQAIMEDPEILILDEPTNGLDDSGLEIIKDIILENKKENKLVLVVSHDKEFLDLICDEIYFIKNGSIMNG